MTIRVLPRSDAMKWALILVPRTRFDLFFQYFICMCFITQQVARFDLFFQIRCKHSLQTQVQVSAKDIHYLPRLWEGEWFPQSCGFGTSITFLTGFPFFLSNMVPFTKMLSPFEILSSSFGSMFIIIKKNVFQLVKSCWLM